MLKHRKCVSRSFRFDLYLLLCLLLLTHAAVSQHKSADNDGADRVFPKDSLPSHSEISRAIELASGYLTRACGPEGKFVYRVDTSSGNESASYNVIRHAGTMYALAMLNRSRPDPQVVKTLVRAAEFLRQNYIGPGIRLGQLAVWSDLVAERSPTGLSTAELGATALGLVALAATNDTVPGTIPLSYLQELGRFLLFLQRDDGSFVSKYIAGVGPVPEWASLYYPGEAALGLIALYKIDHSREWLVAAGKALSFLARSRENLTSVPADHWALIATAELLPYSDGISFIVSREQLIRHGIQICTSILREQITSSTATNIDGAFDPGGRTTPAATRLEGLLAAVGFIPKGGLTNEVEACIGRGIAFLLRSQITAGRYAGGLPGAVGTNGHHSSDVRIDYVQHALCAWLRYESQTDRLGWTAAVPTSQPADKLK
jgi:hypothetical protein